MLFGKVTTLSHGCNIFGVRPRSLNRNKAGDITTEWSPKRTRSQTATEAAPAEMAMTPDAEILRTILQELGRLRKE